MPGTKEGWELVVQNDNRVIIIADEGDDWWASMSKNASIENRGTTLA